jgi:pimeloyl-ACP methyl ester carboxylesterase
MHDTMAPAEGGPAETLPAELSLRLSDGVRLHGTTHGPQTAPMTLFLLHGWTLNQRSWHRQIAALPAVLPGIPVRVVAYDARGHGRSGPTPRRSATLARLGDDLAEVLQAVAPTGPVVLAGHSLGGMAILEYAHRHPDDFAARVGGLVLVSTTAQGHLHTSYGLPGPVARVVRFTELAGASVLARCGGLRPHSALQLALRPGLRWLLFGDLADAADIRLTAASVARVSLRAIGGFRPSVGAQRRLESLATLPQIPTAVLAGERDRLTPPACAEAIAGALPGAELTVYPGAGHMLVLERHAEVTAVLAATISAALAGPAPATPVQTGLLPTRTIKSGKVEAGRVKIVAPRPDSSEAVEPVAQ